MTPIHTVAAYRKRHALTQEELAHLLSVSQSAVARLEHDGEAIKLGTALALQVIFDVQPRLIFRGLYATVEEAVMARAAELDRKVRSKTDAPSLKKQRLLSSIVKRASPAPADA